MSYEIVSRNRSIGENEVNFFSNSACDNLSSVMMLCFSPINMICDPPIPEPPPTNNRCGGGGGVKLTCPGYSVNSRP